MTISITPRTPAPAARMTSFTERENHAARILFQAESDGDYRGMKVTGHPRFASGGVLPTDCLGALFAHAYYNPGTVDVVEALVVSDSVGKDSEARQPWQVAVPPGHNLKTYGDLTQFFLCEHDGALCLGLYRVKHKEDDDESSGVSYVFTNPHPSTELLDFDLAIVLGNAEFGEKLYKDNLIHNAAPTTTL